MCYVIRILWVGEIHYSPLTSFYERRSPPVHLHRTVVRCYVDFLDLRTELFSMLSVVLSSLIRRIRFAIAENL